MASDLRDTDFLGETLLTSWRAANLSDTPLEEMITLFDAPATLISKMRSNLEDSASAHMMTLAGLPENTTSGLIHILLMGVVNHSNAQYTTNNRLDPKNRLRVSTQTQLHSTKDPPFERFADFSICRVTSDFKWQHFLVIECKRDGPDDAVLQNLVQMRLAQKTEGFPDGKVISNY